MTMSIETLGTQSYLPTALVRQGRSHAAVIEPQRPGFDLNGGKDPASHERIAPQPPPARIPPPSIRVDYQQDRPVLLLHDRSGVLIYQIPPKGTLQLIQQEDAPGRSLSERA